MTLNNVQLRDFCWDDNAKVESDICSEPNFLQQACARFTTIMAKIVRLRLMPVKKLLDDPQFKKMKVVYLIRDPRGTLNSREKSFGCTNRDCIDPKQLCQDLSDDIDAFDLLNAQYPDRLLFVKYESLTSTPVPAYRKIFKFAELSIPPFIIKSIRDHTSENNADAFSTYRKKEDVDRWKTTLNKTRLQRIETACRSLLNRLDYPILWHV